MADILLITPPFTQLNTPYPATAYLKGFLSTKGIAAYQMDLGIEVILKLFSPGNLKKVFQIALELDNIQSDNARRIFQLQEDYISTVSHVIAFLQGKRNTLARLILTGNYLPEASRFDQIDDLEWAFGNMGHQDKAKHLATLYLEDLSDFIVECVDPEFGFSRYAEKIARSANSFDEIYNKIEGPPSFIDELSIQLLEQTVLLQNPILVCFSVPFPGNIYSAFRCAKWLKANYPEVKIAMGGGFPNTELRSLKDVRVFEYFDYITLDDGELPLELIYSNLKNPNADNPNFNLFKRTLLIKNEAVFLNDFSLRKDYKQHDLGTPDYSDLHLEDYISVIEVANPMHSLWSDGRWNKLTMAHGCYWAKCTFCDISLSYIKDYEPLTATMLVDRMEEIIRQTGETGFHFVDEAAPPKLMTALALEILKRKLTVTWWTNIRFEKRFTKDLCRLLGASGCIAVSGGLEVASDRLLDLIQKGVTVEQVAQVTSNLSEAGIMVHAYLMYGYPTQSIQETVDSLEMVRQLFEIGIIQSGFWHQFALTAHSPIGMNPDTYSITPEIEPISFANNDVSFVDKTGIDHSQFAFGLKKSLYNFMHGMCFDFHLQEWFDFDIPETTIKIDYIENCLRSNTETITKNNARILWLGSTPSSRNFERIKNGKILEMTSLTFHNKSEKLSIEMDRAQANWLADILEQVSKNQGTTKTYANLKKEYEAHFDSFELFWYNKDISALSAFGLLSF